MKENEKIIQMQLDNDDDIYILTDLGNMYRESYGGTWERVEGPEKEYQEKRRTMPDGHYWWDLM